MLQTRRIPHKYQSVQTQQDLNNKSLKEILVHKEKELELLKIEIEIEIEALRNLLEVRNTFISIYYFTLTLLKLNFWSSIYDTRDFLRDLRVPVSQLSSCVYICRAKIKVRCTSLLS
jgi:hypothetical protein